MLLFRLTAMAAILFVSACTTTPDLNITGPTATLEFHKGYTGKGLIGPGRSAIQFYKYYDDPSCDPVKPMVLTMVTASSRTQPAAAGRRIVVTSETNLLENRALNPSHRELAAPLGVGRSCIMAVGFTPEADHTYAVIQPISASRCWMEVTDKATGKPPPDLVRLAALTACETHLSPPSPQSSWSTERLGG